MTYLQHSPRCRREGQGLLLEALHEGLKRGWEIAPRFAFFGSKVRVSEMVFHHVNHASYAVWICDALFIPNIGVLSCFTMYIHVSKTYHWEFDFDLPAFFFSNKVAVQRYPTNFVLHFSNFCSPSMCCLLAPPDVQISLHRVERCRSGRFSTDPLGGRVVIKVLQFQNDPLISIEYTTYLSFLLGPWC